MQQNQEPPEILVDVSIPYTEWNKEDRRPATLATRAVHETFTCAQLPAQIRMAKTVEVSILLANDDLVRTLNREYRGQDKPTNVLSFPQLNFDNTKEPRISAADYPLNLGDMVLAFETVIGETEEKIIPFDSHFIHLIVHGTLHLLGFDHEAEEEAAVMEDTEIWIMNRMGHKNPYSW